MRWQNIAQEFRLFWAFVGKMQWSLVLAIALVALSLTGMGYSSVIAERDSVIDTKDEEISSLESRIETYFVPQEQQYRDTLTRIAEYISATDMYLNVGGWETTPGYFDPAVFEALIRGEQNEFTELVNDIDLFFNERAEFYDDIPNIWPVRYSRHMRVTSPFGVRFDPFHGEIVDHKGIDIVSVYEAEIIATAPGTVVEHWIMHPVMGKYIIIDHDGRYRTHYAHLRHSFIHEGYVVERGQVLGRMGNTGRSTGMHLDYRIEVRNEETGEWEFVDPQAFLLRAVEDENAPIVTRAELEGEIAEVTGAE